MNNLETRCYLRATVKKDTSYLAKKQKYESTALLN